MSAFKSDIPGVERLGIDLDQELSCLAIGLTGNNVRFGSYADISQRNPHLRSYPKNGHRHFSFPASAWR